MIITLCGSARFEHLFRHWDEVLTLRGHVVFNLAVYPRDKEYRKDWYSPETKRLLDQSHMQKILHSDAILVLNEDGYIGESTKNEITWAQRLGKPIYYLHHVDSSRLPENIPSALQTDAPF